MAKTRPAPLKRIGLDGRGWLALAVLAVLWGLVLRGWTPLVGLPTGVALSHLIHTPALVRSGLSFDIGATRIFGGMAPLDILGRFALYALDTAAVGLVGWLGLALIARIKPFRLLSDAPKFRWRLVLFGLCASAGVILAARIVAATMKGEDVILGWGVGPLPAQMLWGACLLVLTLMVGFFEEAVFRGGLLRLAPKSLWLIPLAVLLNAALFAGVHGAQSPVEFVNRLALGVALGWATLRLRGIELAVGLHAGLDFAAMLLNPAELERSTMAAGASLTEPTTAPQTFPLLVELAAGAVMALAFSIVAVILAELAIRIGGWLKFDLPKGPDAPLSGPWASTDEPGLEPQPV
jgi:membrane protease YdiL (CAAX protease family)